MIRQHVGVSFEYQRHGIVQLKIETQSEAATRETFSIVPEIFQFVSTRIQRVCFVVIETISVCTSCEEVGVKYPVGIEAAEE
ncbi:MAG TPA: hypothetical protein DCS09_00585 [Porphyromonadaceae bacterium]|nr:hypothetical protein [Porphyromonadaceae bacterium]